MVLKCTFWLDSKTFAKVEGGESTTILVYQNNFGEGLEYKCNSLVEAIVNENVK